MGRVHVWLAKAGSPSLFAFQRVVRFSSGLSLLLLGSLTVFEQQPPPAGVSAPCTASHLEKGLIVEGVTANSEGEKAGFRAGDVIQNWSRDDVKGELESPFDLLEIETEQSSRGPVTLDGTRSGLKKVWVMGPDTWGIQARPGLPSTLLAIYREGRKLAKAGKLDEATARWSDAENDSRTSQCSWLGPWLLFHAAQTLADKQQWKESDALYQKAIETTSSSGVKVQLLQVWAESFRLRDDGDNAEKRYLLASNEARHHGPESRAVDVSLTGLGLVAWHRGDLERAEDYFHQVLTIRERLIPGSLALAKGFNNLGNIECLRGDLSRGEVYNRQALQIQERLAPNGLDVAASLNSLGNIADEHKELAKAEDYHRQSLQILKKLAPDSLDMAKGLNGLGIVVLDRGDFAKAEVYFRDALIIFQKLQPGSRVVAASLNNLGDVAEHRGEFARAEDFFEQSLTICEKLEPDSPDVAELLNNVGGIALDSGDFAKADGFFNRSLTIDEKLAPDSLDMAEILNNLGKVARGRRDLVKASEYYRRALEIRTKLAPASAGRAESLADLAEILRDRQQIDEAVGLYAQAIDVVESQVAHLGGSSGIRAGFRAKYAEYYSAYADLLLTQGRQELAFQTIERSRARTLLETLAEAHVDIRQGADPALLERERALQAALAAASNQKINLLEGEHSDQQSAAIDKGIDTLLSQYEEVEGQIRTSNPNYAALTQPQPLTAKQIQHQLLDANTLLLEYELGEKRSVVFVLTPNSVDSYELPKRSEIEETARHLYNLLTSRNRWIVGESASQRAERLAKGEAEYQEATIALSQMVLGPVTGQLYEKRLLIVADGALQYIPFSLLPLPGGTAPRPPVPLVAKHEIVNVPSASVLALLRQQANGREAAPKEVAVFADPVFDKEDPRVGRAAHDNRAAVSTFGEESTASFHGQLTRSLADVGARAPRAGSALPRLVFSRREADAIVAMTDAGKDMEALDFQASREAALSKELGKYRIVHFATHGLLDNDHPELSGLVLSLVDREGNPRNGFLDLEDVYNLTLNADLVVLSACETGLGKQINGEGLVGLTRGFMYAGANRVVASLWKVDDAATSEVMRHFYYGMLKEGLRPAAALRQAQIEMQQQKRWADPYYWAAFTIQGEWK